MTTKTAQPRPYARWAAMALAAIFAGLAIFQLLLALGFPLGRAAWGGMVEVLPTSLRIASLVSILIYGVATLFLFEKAGIIHLINRPRLTNIAVWVLTAYFGLGIVLNLISRSPVERAIMTPLVLIIFILCLIVARRRPESQSTLRSS